MSNGQWKTVPVEPTPEIIAAAALAVWPVASAKDIDVARRAAKIVLLSMDVAPGTTPESLYASLATMAPAYRAMLAAAPDAPSAEPVAWMSPGKERLEFSRQDTVYGSHTLPLYALPPDAAAEIARMRDLLDEQKGTIRALNMALAGEDFPTTEHLVAAHEIDPGCAGLISICMELRAERDEALLIHQTDTGTASAVAALQSEVERLQQARAICPTCACKIDDAVGVDVAAKNRTIKQQAERISELEREVEEYDDALLASDADLMKAQDQAKALATAVMTDQVSNDSHALFIAAIRDLAAISEALGCDPDDGGAVPIIEAIDELKETIDAQTVALAKAKEALEGVCDSDEECQDSDGWTAAVISLEALHEAQEALETIAQFDGAHAEEHAHPASDADNAIYQSIARNYTAQAGEEGKEPRHD